MRGSTSEWAIVLNQEGRTPVDPHAQRLVNGFVFGLYGQDSNITPGGSQGVNFADYRVVSQSSLRLNGELLRPVHREMPVPFALTERLAAAGAPGLTVDRERSLPEDGRHDYAVEQTLLRVTNTTSQAVMAELVLDQDTDFLDTFKVKQAIRPSDTAFITHTRTDGTVSWHQPDPGANEPQRPNRAVRLVSNRPFDTPSPGDPPTRIRYTLRLEPGGHEDIGIQSFFLLDDRFATPERDLVPAMQTVAAQEYGDWRKSFASVRTGNPQFNAMFDEALKAHWQLRLPIVNRVDNETKLIGFAMAAGIPWYGTFFARDEEFQNESIRLFAPEFSIDTFKLFAMSLATQIRPAESQWPGKPPHEWRFFRSNTLDPRHAQCLYESIDAPPEAITMFNEARKAGADPKEVAALMPFAERIMTFIELYALQALTPSGQKYLVFSQAGRDSTAIQTWKDHPLSTVYFNQKLDYDGQPDREALPPHPLAMAEAQAYLFGAYLAMSELYAAGGDTHRASHYAGEAARLKANFNTDFLVTDSQAPYHIPYVAIALDGNGNKVDGLADDMYLCMSKGLLSGENVDRAAALLRLGFMSGSGLRTMHPWTRSANPDEYQRGGVWDQNTRRAAGALLAHGKYAEADLLMQEAHDACVQNGNRPVELTKGTRRRMGEPPPPYESACDPQGWTASGPMRSIRDWLGIRVDIPRGENLG